MRKICKKSKSVAVEKNMTQEYYKSFNTREEEVTRNRRGIALRQVEVNKAPIEQYQNSQEYEQLMQK